MMARSRERTAPAISYHDALRLPIAQRVSVASASAEHFRKWAFQQAEDLAAEKQAAVKIELRTTYDYNSLVDRWHAVTLLAEAGAPLKGGEEYNGR